MAYLFEKEWKVRGANNIFSSWFPWRVLMIASVNDAKKWLNRGGREVTFVQ